MSGFLLFVFLLPFAAQSPGQNKLLISPNDIRIEKVEGGCNLFIRKKDGLESVMLTETTKDPLGKEDNYAYRAREWNAPVALWTGVEDLVGNPDSGKILDLFRKFN